MPVPATLAGTYPQSFGFAMCPSITQLLSFKPLVLAGINDIWQLPAEPWTRSSRLSSRASICTLSRAAINDMVTMGPSVAEMRERHCRVETLTLSLWEDDNASAAEQVLAVETSRTLFAAPCTQAMPCATTDGCTSSARGGLFGGPSQSEFGISAAPSGAVGKGPVLGSGTPLMPPLTGLRTPHKVSFPMPTSTVTDPASITPEEAIGRLELCANASGSPKCAGTQGLRTAGSTAGGQAPPGYAELFTLIHEMRSQNDATAREGIVQMSAHMDEMHRKLLAHVSDNRAADRERADAIQLAFSRVIETQMESLETGLMQTISSLPSGKSEATSAVGNADNRRESTIAGKASFTSAIAREHASAMTPRPNRGGHQGDGGTNAGPMADTAFQRNPHVHHTGNAELCYQVVTTLRRSYVSNDVLLGESWLPTMQTLEPTPDEYEFSMLAAGTEIGLVELPDGASVAVAHAHLLLHMEETRLADNGCTLRVGMPLAWPSEWTSPAIAEGARPVYFAYVHLHAGPAVESIVVERLEGRLRSEVNAFDVGTVYFHHRMEWVASKARLSDQAQACLRQLLALIDATGTTQLPTPAGRVIPMDVGVLAVPGETARSTEPARLDRLLVKQLLECLPDWPPSQSVQRWHLRIVMSFTTGMCREVMSVLLTREDGSHALMTALIEKMLRAPHAQILQSVFDDPTNIARLEHLCTAHREHLKIKYGVPLGRNAKPTEALRYVFGVHLSETLMAQRACPYAQSFDALGRGEARRTCQRPRRGDIDDTEWLRENFDGFNGFITLWGPEISERLVEGEMQDFLEHVVLGLQGEIFKERILRTAEEFVNTKARDDGVPVETMFERSLRARPFPAGEPLTSSQLRMAQTFHGATVGHSIMRFFQTPQDLRKIATLGELIPFVRVLATSVLGPVNMASQLSISGKPVDGAIMHVTSADGAGVRALEVAADPMYLPPPFVQRDDVATWYTERRGPGVDYVGSKKKMPPSTTFAIEHHAEPAQDLVGVQRMLAEMKADAQKSALTNELLIEERMKEVREKQEKFHRDFMSNYASATSNTHAQLSNIAKHTELSKAVAMQAVVESADATVPRMEISTSTMPALAHALLAMPSGGQNVGQSARRFEQSSAGQSVGQPTRRFEQSTFVPRRRPPARDKDNKIIMRLTNKPATPWEALPDFLKPHLATYGIHDKAAWEAMAEKPCQICGPDADHWWSRCVKVWAATGPGQKFLGAAKASERVHEAMKRKGTATSTVSGLHACVECALEVSGSDPGLAVDVINWVSEFDGILPDDDPAEFYQSLAGVFALSDSMREVDERA